MSKYPFHRTPRLAVLVLAAVAALQANAQTPQIVAPATSANPSSGLYIDYTLNSAHTTANFEVCGSVTGSSGCYGSGSLGTYGRIGAMIEGSPYIDTATNTVTRYVYIVDQASGGGSSTAVALYAYAITEVINAPSVSVTVRGIKAVGLALIGGMTAQTYLAGMKGYLFVGTNQSQNAVEVSTSSYATGSIGGFSPPINSSSITADQFGDVTTTFGPPSGIDGFYSWGPGGAGLGDGGGADVMVGTTQALLMSDLTNVSTTPADLAPRVHVNYHNSN